MTRSGFVKKIGDGGFGSEAAVTIELRTRIPGLGGTIITDQAIVTAKRENLNAVEGVGLRDFLRHALIKKLEDYFQKCGKYAVSHITRPIGSFSDHSRGARQEGYLYEWVFGSEGFPWFYTDEEYRTVPIALDEWSAFTGVFHSAGINLSMDCCDADNANISKNIIHKLSSVPITDLNCLWYRIDLGAGSISIDHDQLKAFVKKHARALICKLGVERYELISLAIKFLYEHNAVTPKEMGKLELLARAYRLSAMRHFVARVSGEDAKMTIKS